MKRYYGKMFALIMATLLMIYLLFASGCMPEQKIKNNILLPPVDGVVWGMSEEDAKDTIGLETYEIVSENEWICNYQKEIQVYFGKPAVVGLSFSRIASQGLSYVYLEFDTDLTDAEIERIEHDLGRQSVLVQNRRVIDSRETVSELSEEIRTRLKCARIDLVAAESDTGNIKLNASERWEVLEQTPLVTVTIFNDLIRFDAEVLTAAILCQDKETYDLYYSTIVSIWQFLQ